MHVPAESGALELARSTASASALASLPLTLTFSALAAGLTEAGAQPWASPSGNRPVSSDYFRVVA